MKFNNIIIQAGGKGTRLEYLTYNKPKALVPIDNLPMIFHLFRKYPDKKYIIIGDYKQDVLEKYLAAFADVDYEVVTAHGHTGTCAGLSGALDKVPPKEPFMLIWCDLILNQEFSTEQLEEGNYVGLSLGYECRWKYENGVFSEEKSSTCGVTGMFLFQNKEILASVPEDGEFVRWLSQKDIKFRTVTLDRTREFGLLSEYNKLKTAKCRPFNKITVEEDYIIKEAIDEQGRRLAVREKAWYEKTKALNFTNLPQIYSVDPLKLEKIDGRNIYEYTDISLKEKRTILREIIDCLKCLHGYGSVPYDEGSFLNAYVDKTFERLEKVRALVPFADQPDMVINGKICRNVFSRRQELMNTFLAFKPDKFVFLHGDCTFSNIMLRNGREAVLIDPRGYFGKTEFYGDAAYDWAKLYYSLIGNYDQFNLKRFQLKIKEKTVELKIQSSGWEELEEYFFELLVGEADKKYIQLIHAIIWLSLTTYAWEDYDSICGAFYNGLYYLEEVL